MKRKNLARLASVILASVLAISSFAGCGNQKTNGEETAVDSTSTDTTASDKGPSWTWDKSPVTLDWYVNFDWYTGKWYPDALIMKKITEDTGITVNFITPPAGTTDKLNTMIASDSLSDIITLGNWEPQYNLVQDSGMVESLLDISKSDAPELEKNIAPSLQNWYRHKDGNLYVYPTGASPVEYQKTSPNYNSNSGVIARKDIMDQLGIKPEDFNTQEGMIAALKKVKDSNSTYKGLKIEPFYIGPTGGVGDTFKLSFPQMFGIKEEDSSGNFADWRVQPKSLEIFQFANRLWKEGLIVKENFTAQRKQIEEKVSKGSLFCFVANIPDFADAMKTLKRSDDKVDFVGVGPVLAKDGAEPIYKAGAMGWAANMISSSSDKKARAARFMAYLSSQEGQILTNFGVEGVTYTKGGEDGHLKFMPEYQDATKADATAATQKYGIGALWLLNNDALVGSFSPISDKVDDVMISNINDYNRKYCFDASVLSNIDPEAGTDEANTLTQVSEYFNNQLPKLVLAASEADVEKIFNETVKHMKDLGNDKLTENKNIKFQENKKKMQITSVYAK